MPEPASTNGATAAASPFSAPIPHWSDEDFAILDEEIGGPTPVPFFGPGRPEVTIDFSGIDTLILLNKIGNPLIEASQRVSELVQARERRVAEAAAKAAEGDPDEDDEPEDAAALPAETDDPELLEPNEQPEGFFPPQRQAAVQGEVLQRTENADVVPEAPVPDGWRRTRNLAVFHDLVGQAIWIDPPWQPMADLLANGRRPGHFSVVRLTMEQRNRLVDILYRGVDALATFREQPASAPAPLPGDGLREGAERLPDPPRAEAPETVVRPGDLAAGAGHRGGAERGRRRSAAS